MATYIDESALLEQYVDESSLVGAAPKKEKKPDVEAGGNLISRLLASGATGPSKMLAGLVDLATQADLNFRRRFGLPTMGVKPSDVALSPKVDVLREAIAQGSMFPVEREPSVAERVTQAGTGSLMFPGGAISNLGAATTSELLQEEVKEAGGGAGTQAIVGLLGALPWSLKSPSHLMRTPQQQAEKSIAGYTPQQLQAGMNLQKEAAKAGLPISPAQAMNDKGRIFDLENFVMDSPFAPPSLLREAMSQPERAKSFAERIARTFGSADDSLLRSNQIEKIIEEALQFPVKAAGKAAAPYYSAFNQMRPQLSVAQRFSLADDLGRITDDVGLLPGSASGRAVEGIAGTVTQPSVILNQAGHPFRLAAKDARSLDNYLKEVSEQVSGTYGPFSSSAEKVQRAGLVPGASSIREAVTDASPVLRRGKEVYQQTVERLEPGVRATGLREAVARPAMEESAAKAAASWTKLESVLKKGNESDVARALNVMKTEKGGKEAFVDITKNALKRVFDSKFASESGDPKVSLSFAEELKKYPNIRKAVELSAAETGARNPRAVADGFMRALDIQQAAGRARGLPGGATVSEIEKYAAGKSGTSLVFGHGIARAATLVRNIQYRINQAEMKVLSSALDSPESLRLLVELSKTKGPIGMTENALYKALIGVGTVEQPVGSGP